MIALHYYPSTASMAPNILLEEIGAPFERVLVDRSHNVHKTQQFLQLNPNGLIPVSARGRPAGTPGLSGLAIKSGYSPINTCVSS